MYNKKRFSLILIFLLLSSMMMPLFVCASNTGVQFTPLYAYCNFYDTDGVYHAGVRLNVVDNVDEDGDHYISYQMSSPYNYTNIKDARIFLSIPTYSSINNFSVTFKLSGSIDSTSSGIGNHCDNSLIYFQNGTSDVKQFWQFTDNPFNTITFAKSGSDVSISSSVRTLSFYFKNTDSANYLANSQLVFIIYDLTINDQSIINAESITNAIDAQTDAIEEQTETIEEQGQALQTAINNIADATSSVSAPTFAIPEVTNLPTYTFDQGVFSNLNDNVFTSTMQYILYLPDSNSLLYAFLALALLGILLPMIIKLLQRR